MTSYQQNKDPMVSVVIAAYNCAKWIELTVRDVLSQTYTDFELIVVDDGSTDSTAKIIGSFNDPRISYVRQENSGAPAKPRNTGLARSSGSYISFLDHDDRWTACRLERVMAIFFSMPSVDIVCHDEKVVSNSKVVSINHYGPNSETLYLDMLLHGNRLSTSATTLKTSVVRKENGFDERKEFISVEDFDLWLRLARANCKFYFLDDILGEYTLNGSNLSSNINKHNHSRSIMINEHLNTKGEFLSRYKKRIVGYGDYSFARDLHRNGIYGKAISRYFEAFKKGYLSYKVFAGLVLSLMRIEV